MIHLKLYTNTKKGYQSRKFRSRSKAMEHCKAFGLELSQHLQGEKITIYTKSRDTCITCTAQDQTQSLVHQMIKGLKITSPGMSRTKMQYMSPTERSMYYMNNSQSHLYPFTVSLC
jgi:hypothetical protein